MKRKRFWRFGLALCLAAVMMLSVCLPVLAAQAETGVKGSVRLQLPKGQENLEMMLYQIADYQDGSFIFHRKYADSGVPVTDLNDSAAAQAAAEKLADYAAEIGDEGELEAPDANGMVNFTGLKPGLYLAAQVSGKNTLAVQPALVPVPYTGGDGAPIYDAVLSPKYAFPGGAVIVNKVDDEGNAVGQAVFQLQEKVVLKEGETAPEGAEAGTDESGSFYWKELQANLVSDENGQIAVTDMPVGSYRFVETEAPDGYVRNGKPAEFQISQAGQVVRVNELYEEGDGHVERVEVVNDRTYVEINKVDEEGNPVSGARLVLKDADGQVIVDENGEAKYAFISGEEPQVIRALPAGDYYLSEVAAPDGYLVAKDVPLTVSDTEAVICEVSMVDEREEVTPGSLIVTKHLVDFSDNEISSKDGVFYVALFADEGRTERISGVKALEYHGQSTASVVFSNLEIGKSYFVGETDMFGNPLEEVEVGKVICVPFFPDVYEVTPTETEPEHLFEFDNMFGELPDGYYYVGKLTVTKKVLKGTEPLNSNAVYYAAVFEDKELKSRVGDVLTLDMAGGSETTVTVDVPIGDTEEAAQTYYVAETDKNGTPLDTAKNLAFAVSIDQAELTMSLKDSEKSVVITNTFPLDTPTPTPGVTQTITPTVTPEATPTVPTGSGGGTGTTGGGGSSTQQVRTGDDTPIGMFVIILGAAVILICIVVILIYRKKNK